MKKTIIELSKQAIEVQDACNLLGVSKSFALAVEELFYSNECNRDMNKLNNHPVITLWIDKLLDMNGRPCFEKIMSSWDYVKKQIEERS